MKLIPKFLEPSGSSKHPLSSYYENSGMYARLLYVDKDGNPVAINPNPKYSDLFYLSLPETEIVAFPGGLQHPLSSYYENNTGMRARLQYVDEDGNSTAINPNPQSSDLFYLNLPETEIVAPYTGNGRVVKYTDKNDLTTKKINVARQLFGDNYIRPAMMMAGITGALAIPGLNVAVNGYFAYDGLKNFAGEEGVLKTYNYLKDGLYGKATLSGLGDVANLAGSLGSGWLATTKGLLYSKPLWQPLLKDALFGGMIMTNGHEGFTVQNALNKAKEVGWSPFFKYFLTKNKEYLEPYAELSDGNIGGAWLDWGARDKMHNTGRMLKLSNYDLLLFPEKHPTGSTIMDYRNSIEGGNPDIAAPLITSEAPNPEHAAYFSRTYPGQKIRTVNVNPGSDAISMSELQDPERFIYAGHSNINKGTFPINSSPGVEYDAGGYKRLYYLDKKWGDVYTFDSDANKYNVNDFTRKWLNSEELPEGINKSKLWLTKKALSILDKNTTPHIVRSEIRKVKNPWRLQIQGSKQLAEMLKTNKDSGLGNIFGHITPYEEPIKLPTTLLQSGLSILNPIVAANNLIQYNKNE